MWVNREAYVNMKAEIAMLKERVLALNNQIGDLRDGICKFEDALAAERKRSDNAVDRLLNSKGLPAVTPPDKITLDELSNTFEETEEGVAAIRKAIEQHGIEDVLLAGVE